MRKTLLYILLFLDCAAVSAQEDSASRYMRLFTPLRHYNNVVEDKFSLDGKGDSIVDNLLLRTYLLHPELVKGKPGNKEPRNQETDKKKSEKKKQEDLFVAPDIDNDFASVDLVVTKPNFWTINGDCYLQMMQSTYSDNWYQGGQSNYSGIARVTIDLNYNNKQKIKFENKLEMELGLQTFSDDSVHKARSTSDLLRNTTSFRIKAAKNWYYTLQNVASTQFVRSFDSNSSVVNSAFMSPFTDNISLGMDYNVNWLNGRLTGNAHFAPFAVNLKHVSRLELAEKNGIDEGCHNKWELGPNFNIDVTWKICDMVEWKTRLYGFTSFHRVDLQWENTINLKFSKFIAATIYVYPKFDDSAERNDKWGYFQLKEFTSLGLTYSF